MSATGNHAPRVCPYFGIAGDIQSHFSFPESSHRCHARRPPQPIDLAYQGAVCMGAAHPGCPYFLRAEHGGAAGDPRQHRAIRALAGVGAAALLAMAVLLAVALGRLVIEDSSGAFADPTQLPGPVVSTTPSPSPTDRGLVSPTPGPLASPSPSPEPTPAQRTPTPAPTEAATPTVAPTPLIHIVRPGETLTYLAELYGVPVPEIAEANGLEDSDHILIDQRLLIPSPED